MEKISTMKKLSVTSRSYSTINILPVKILRIELNRFKFPNAVTLKVSARFEGGNEIIDRDRVGGERKLFRTKFR